MFTPKMAKNIAIIDLLISFIIEVVSLFILENIELNITINKEYIIPWIKPCFFCLIPNIKEDIPITQYKKLFPIIISVFWLICVFFSIIVSINEIKIVQNNKKDNMIA